MSVTLTEKAAKEVQRVMSEQKMPEETILRVGVVGGGEFAGQDHADGESG